MFIEQLRQDIVPQSMLSTRMHLMYRRHLLVLSVLFKIDIQDYLLKPLVF